MYILVIFTILKEIICIGIGILYGFKIIILKELDIHIIFI